MKLFFVTFVYGLLSSAAAQGNSNGRGNGNGNGNGVGNGKGRGPPDWVLAKLPDMVVARFQEDNMLKEDADPSFQSIPQGSSSFEIEGTLVSLADEDLVALDIMADGARVKVDGEEQILSPSVFKSAKDDSVIISKNSHGKLMSASKSNRGRSVQVVPIANDQDVFITVTPEDLDQDKINDLYVLDEEIYPPNGRSLRQRAPDASALALDEDHDNRELQTSCSEFKVIEIGVYVDSFMCANEGSSSAAFNSAVNIVAQASQKYQAFCKKLKVKEIQVFCNAGGDAMRSAVSGQSNSVCDNNNVLDAFRAYVSNSSNNPPEGDIIHLFSGKSYPNNSRCIGSAYVGTVCSVGYNTGINEMSTWGAISRGGLLAHETGHNAGANHDSTGIMASSGYSSFSANSIAAINAHVNSRTCVATELPNGTEITCPPGTDSPTWSYFGNGFYTCSWLASQQNTPGYCSWYSAFRDNCRASCPATC